VAVLALLALWGLAGGPELVASKALANNKQAYREAKMRQDADRRAAEMQRQQILANTRAKFDETYRQNPRYDATSQWRRRYRKTGNSFENQ
jgi:hypothetical protein